MAFIIGTMVAINLAVIIFCIETMRKLRRQNRFMYKMLFSRMEIDGDKFTLYEEGVPTELVEIVSKEKKKDIVPCSKCGKPLIELEDTGMMACRFCDKETIDNINGKKE